MGRFCPGMSVSHLLGLWAFRLVLLVVELVVESDVVKSKEVIIERDQRNWDGFRWRLHT